MRTSTYKLEKKLSRIHTIERYSENKRRFIPLIRAITFINLKITMASKKS